MLRFKCSDCGECFDEPEDRKEYRGECWGIPAYETVSYCPFCGSDDFHEAKDDEDDMEEE